MWKELMKYPQLIEYHSYINVAPLLDLCEQLIPVPDEGMGGAGRSDRLMTWLSRVNRSGIITTKEHDRIVNYMIHGPGGL